MQQLLTALGKDCVMFIDASEFPLPYEYRFLPLDGHVSEPPADLDERTVVFLDCGNLERNPAEALQRGGHGEGVILNIDHHHDNTRFGTANLVDPGASCTAEIVWELMRGLELPLTLSVAEALYVGLITDTGNFMYGNTGPRAHVMAAELIEAGVDVHRIYQYVYEGVPFAKLLLLARASATTTDD
jgi:phosphoesterase RecJ-like protein